jgi:flagellin-like protein
MRPLRRLNRRGLSEIVGTLMLVLIVVGAAVAFSAFVASYQKQVQAEEAVTHQRALENLKILEIQPTLYAKSTSNVSLLNLTVASLDVENTVLSGLSINGVPVKTYVVTAIYPANGTLTPLSVAPGEALTIAPQQQVFIQIDFNMSHPIYSMYAANFVLLSTQVIKVDLYTALLNDFFEAFSPPTAVAFISAIQSFSGTSYVTVPVLDGSDSLQPGNGSLISWSWNVTNLSSPLPHTFQDLAGEKAVPTVYAAFNYVAQLVVRNNVGLIGVATTPTFN